jgi:2-amino-4-hydroxy-6-hydroxymethyldihydropteridine diphosphokinase
VNARLAAIALGSNLGDRESHLQFARESLTQIFGALRASRIYETTPVDVDTQQGLFLNQVVVAPAILSARLILEALLRIESERGRERPFPNAPRTLDLDLVLLGDQVIDEPGLTVPHPRFRERRFVLEPLAEIASTMRDPVSGKTAAELLAQLPQVAASSPRRGETTG